MADLQAPIVPVPDTSALQYVAKGLAGMAANRRYQQNYELAYQKMVQDAALDQQKFELTREQVANSYEVQQAQIENIHAQTKEHIAQAGYIENVKGRDSERKKDILSRIPDYVAEAAKLQLGTADGRNGLADLNYRFNDIAEVPGGRDIMAKYQTEQRLKENQNASALVNLNTRFQQSLKPFKDRGIDPGLALEKLEYNPKTQKFVPNDYWGVDKTSGSPFLTFPADVPLGKPIGSVLAPSEAEKQLQEQKEARFPKEIKHTYYTLDRNQAKRLLEMKSTLDKSFSGPAAPPVDAMEQAVKQQNALDPDTAKAILDEAGGDKIRARQIARERGYHF